MGFTGNIGEVHQFGVADIEDENSAIMPIHFNALGNMTYEYPEGGSEQGYYIIYIWTGITWDNIDNALLGIPDYSSTEIEAYEGIESGDISGGIYQATINLFNENIPQNLNSVQEFNVLRITAFAPQTIINGTTLYYPPMVDDDIHFNWGEIEAEVFDSGDVNQDGVVNVIDIVVLVNAILGIIEPTEAMDVNQDGTVNIVDIINTVNIILNE